MRTSNRKELTPAKIKSLLPKLTNSQDGPIWDIYEESHFNDEPKIVRFSAKLAIKNWVPTKHSNIEYAGGTSFIRSRAIVKVIGESVERYSLTQYSQNELIKGKQKSLKNTMELSTLAGVKATSNLANQNLLWIKSHSLFDNKRYLVPAQLVFVPYTFVKNEPILRLPITTGAASGTSSYGALYRAICECVERDAFMIFYLNKLSAPRVKIRDNKALLAIENYLKRYLLELHLFEITTDIAIPTMLAVVVDKTGKGPAISVGAKTSLKSFKAAVGAIEEALHTRLWVKGEMFKKHNLKAIEAKRHQIITFRERGLFWSSLSRIDDLAFLLKSSSKTEATSTNKERKDSQMNFNSALKKLRECNLNGFYVDVTTPGLAKLGFKAVKVIIPKLQPLYLHENMRYWTGERLSTVPKKLGYKKTDKLNEIPHPFL